MVGASELGYWAGLRAVGGAQESKRSQMLTLEAVVPALLGLLVAFTFSMAGTLFQGRRELVVEEANAIGTAYLRTSLLPEPARTDVRQALRRYLDLRLQADKPNL